MINNLQTVGEWSLSPLRLKLQDPVPSDITVACCQTPKNITILASEIGLQSNEVNCTVLNTSKR